MRHRHIARAGFSLLELSVSIAIIGLLIGGVVVGYSYVKNAELTATMTEGRYYINAFGQFRERYQAIPGDMATATNVWPAITGVSAALNGDGNGLIRSSSAAGNPEIFYAFQHLSRALLIEGNYTGATAGGGTVASAGVNVPRGAFSGTAYMFDRPDVTDGNVSSNAVYFDGLYSHVLRVAALPGNASGLPNQPFLTPAQALEIDSKFDDGMPGTGWILTPKMSSLANCATGNTTAATYNGAITTPACYLFLKLP